MNKGLIVVASFVLIGLSGCTSSRATTSKATAESADIPAKEYDAPLPLVWASLKQAVRDLDWKILSEDESTRVLSVKTPMSIWTWGDSVTLVAATSGTGRVRVHVTSSTGQSVDWGKNEKNIEAVYAKLDAHLAKASSDGSAAAR